MSNHRTYVPGMMGVHLQVPRSQGPCWPAPKGAWLCALSKPSHGITGCGYRPRRSPTGGGAKEMPLKETMLPCTTPATIPPATIAFEIGADTRGRPGVLQQAAALELPVESLLPKPATGNGKRVNANGASKLAHSKGQRMPDSLSLLSLEGPKPIYLR